MALGNAGGADGKAPAGKAPPPPMQVPDRSHFRISAGVSYRTLRGAQFRTGSESQGVRLPFLAAVSGRGPSGAGPADEYADRDYHDGFVHQDGGTARWGDTWNWGYHNASQVRGDGLVYHGEGGTRTTSGSTAHAADGGDWGLDATGAAPVVQVDWLYDVKPSLSAGLSLQWSFLGFDAQHSGSTFSASQWSGSRQVNVIDAYALGGVIPPQAPSFGSEEGPGPLINNIPSSRNTANGRLLEHDSVRFFNRIDESLDVDLNTLSIGPSVEINVGPVQLALGAGLALNIAGWDASHKETLHFVRGRSTSVLKQWAYHESGTTVLPGGYVQAGLTLPLTPRFTITAFGRYDWSEQLTGSVGPSTFSVDPSGWSVGAMAGVTF